MKRTIFLTCLICSLAAAANPPQLNTEQEDDTQRRYFVGSTLLMLGNFIPNDPNRPDFVQINLGYRITPKHVVFLELKTSKFNWPLGMPWSELVDEQRQQYNFPGYVRQYLVGAAYNYFWWKGLYTGVHTMHAYQVYNNENGVEIATGYTLFVTYRLGYHFRFFDNLFFIEPSIGLTHWPIKTNTPPAFEAKESRWPKYFGFEPGLHFGFNFNL